MIKRKYNWAEIDWSQSTTQIARQLGCRIEYVSVNRKKYATSTIRERKNIDWSSVDWLKSTKELAKELGVKGYNLSAARRKYAPETVGRKDLVLRTTSNRTELISPNGVILVMTSIKNFVMEHKDLFEPDDLVEKQVKTSTGYIKTYNNAVSKLSRLRCGRIREWKGWKLKGESITVSRRRKINWNNVDWSEKLSVIANKLKVTVQTVSSAKYKYAPNTINEGKMKKSVHISKKSEEYISNRSFSVDSKNYSAHINNAFEQLEHLSNSEKPKLSDSDWVEIYNVYAGSDLTRLLLPLNIARDLMTHYGATVTRDLPINVQKLADTLSTMTQSQQFSVIDHVRLFWSNV